MSWIANKQSMIIFLYLILWKIGIVFTYNSQIPIELVQKYFPTYRSLHDLRVNLLQSIDKTRTARIERGMGIISTSRIPVDQIVLRPAHLPNFSAVPSMRDEEYPIGRKPVVLHRPRVRPTTPQVLLDILKQVERPKKSTEATRDKNNATIVKIAADDTYQIISLLTQSNGRPSSAPISFPGPFRPISAKSNRSNGPKSSRPVSARSKDPYHPENHRAVTAGKSRLRIN